MSGHRQERNDAPTRNLRSWREGRGGAGGEQSWGVQGGATWSLSQTIQGRHWEAGGYGLGDPGVRPRLERALGQDGRQSLTLSEGSLGGRVRGMERQGGEQAESTQGRVCGGLRQVGQKEEGETSPEKPSWGGEKDPGCRLLGAT